MHPVCMSAVGQTNVTNTTALNKKAEKKSNILLTGSVSFCSVSLWTVLRMYEFRSERPVVIFGNTVIEFSVLHRFKHCLPGLSKLSNLQLMVFRA